MITTAQALPVAIIGAGLAGLSCAQALVQAGHQVHVFDKSRGPSGRMSTRRTEDHAGPWQCDHGAQYFTARDATFRAEVARWQQAGVAALWDARLASFDGSTWSTPETPLERFVGTPRMTSPAAWLVQGLQQAGECTQTQWQTTVQRLERQADGWALTSAEHGLHAQRYSAVLLAVPAPPGRAVAAAHGRGRRCGGRQCPHARQLGRDGALPRTRAAAVGWRLHQRRSIALGSPRQQQAGPHRAPRHGNLAAACEPRVE